MSQPKPTQIQVRLLKDFVYEAKRKSFADAGQAKLMLNDDSSLYAYKESDNGRYGGMRYTDHYTGNVVDVGDEIVSIAMVRCWFNQYYGGLLRKYWSTFPQGCTVPPSFEGTFADVVTRFLKESLMCLPKDFPVRGPQVHESDGVTVDGVLFPGVWRYENSWEATPLFDGSEHPDPFLSFAGRETIILNGEQVFFHVYHGGVPRDKRHPLVYV